MPKFSCNGCGAQYHESETPPPSCIVCADARHYIHPSGQAWTSQEVLKRRHANEFRRHEPDILGIGSTPKYAIGQRALLVQTPEGNVLWDCISLLDQATIDIVKGLGGLKAIAVSHPHY